MIYFNALIFNTLARIWINGALHLNVRNTLQNTSNENSGQCGEETVKLTVNIENFL